MKIKNTFYTWLTNRFILIIRNEENFAVKRTFSFNYAKLIVLLILACTIIFCTSLYAINTVLARWYNPKHTQLETTRKVIILSSKVDSLALELTRKDKYIYHFKSLITGEILEDNEDNVKKVNRDRVNVVNIDKMSAEDSLLRIKFEQESLHFHEMSKRKVAAEFDNLHFVSPVEGFVNKNTAEDEYLPGVFVYSRNAEPVKSLLPGTVILSGSTGDKSVIIVQHDQDLLSVYKFQGSTARKQGDGVEGGELLGHLAKNDQASLYFEVWYAGNPMNPEYFVSF